MKSLIMCIFIFQLNSIFAGDLPRVRGNGGQPYGCVTADTLIELESGEEIEIQMLSNDNNVVTSNGSVAGVLYAISGVENKKMIKLVTKSGRTIVATIGHPFYDKDGFKRTDMFKVGEMIATVDGLEELVEISDFEYNGIVYNLANFNRESDKENLEKRDPFLGLTSIEHTVRLNGFISGDIIIQTLLEK